MFDPSALNELAKRLAESMPSDLQLLKSDLEKNFHAILQASFSRMNLVSREEFDVQRDILEKSRERLEALEKRIAELEGRAPAP
jgi:BMFP domain-containing protein YqiC